MQPQAIKLSGSIPSGTLFNHSLLYNRDAEGAHTIESIDGLKNQLDQLDCAIKNTEKMLSARSSLRYNQLSDTIKRESTRSRTSEAALSNAIDQLNTTMGINDIEVLDQAKGYTDSVKQSLTHKYNQQNATFNRELDNLDRADRSILSQLDTLRADTANDDAEILIQLGTINTNLQAYINTTHNTLQNDLRELEDSLNTGINNLKTDLTGQINGIIGELDAGETVTLASLDDKLDTEIENLDKKLDDEITLCWKTPGSLIFESRDDLEAYINNNSNQAYPGLLVTILNKGVLETYIIDKENKLQRFGSGGNSGGNGSIDTGTDSQYCIQTALEIQDNCNINIFINGGESITKINVPKQNSKNNKISTFDCELPGAYVYYISKIKTLIFTSEGFPAGIRLTEIKVVDDNGDDTGYCVYRSNQKLTKSVSIDIS